jgi:Ca2+-binding RTX toxin-like protein
MYNSHRGCFTEPLEGRRLFAGVWVAGGIIRIIGSRFGPDTIVVGLSADQSTINASVTFPTRTTPMTITNSFPASAPYRAMLILGSLGADSITIDQSNGAFHLNTLMNASAGNDTVLAGNENDTIICGGGNDYVDASGGDDFVRCITGNNTVFGNDGTDRLYGGFGSDYLDGGRGNDILLGGPSNDTLIGGDGNDGMNGGPGYDSLDGGLGNDTLFDAHGRDTMIGGDGQDVFRAFALRGNPVNDFTQGTDIFRVIVPPSSGGNGFLDDLVNGFTWPL